MVAVLLSACGDSGQEQPLPAQDLPAPEQANYETTQVREGEYIRTAGGSMNIYYPMVEELRWEGDNARLREFLVKSGQEVKAGDCLATFDIEVSRAEKEELSLALQRTTEDTEAGKEKRQTAIDEARKKAEELRGHELRVARLEIEKLEIEYEQFVYQSEREIARLQERIKELEEEAANDSLFAPCDGVIDKIASYNTGDLIAVNDILITMHAIDRFYLVTDDSFSKLRYNMEVTVEAGKRNDRKTYVGRVIAAPSVLPVSVHSNMTLVELCQDIPPEELKGSLQYQCNVEELQGILLVDWRAVSSENGKSFVYVLENDMVQKRYIVPGLNNREETWILDGLSLGQTVIAD